MREYFRGSNLVRAAGIDSVQHRTSYLFDLRGLNFRYCTLVKYLQPVWKKGINCVIIFSKLNTLHLPKHFYAKKRFLIKGVRA